jgi:RHH-type proline utilization regulon transcriptional repressor/proline dehydrogenase/delta 1-pyrroline-5-carboxylate dehydrogenase
VIGQDNILCYVPRKKLVFRVQKQDSLIDVLRVLAAALCSKVFLEISFSESPVDFSINWKEAYPHFIFKQESEESFLERVEKGDFEHIRLLNLPSEKLRKVSAEARVFLDVGAPLANGRWELLHYVREVAISYDYHRYGNLGVREKERRNPIF